jgi:hypothetical protein
MSQQDLLTKRELARVILRELFADGPRTRITIEEAVEAGRQRDVSRRTLSRAAKDLGVRDVQNGRSGGFWELAA